MLRLFKGELSYHDILRGMTYKEMLALRDARIRQMEEENKQRKDAMTAAQEEEIRKSILM